MYEIKIVNPIVKIYNKTLGITDSKLVRFIFSKSCIII